MTPATLVLILRAFGGPAVAPALLGLSCAVPEPGRRGSPAGRHGAHAARRRTEAWTWLFALAFLASGCATAATDRTRGPSPRHDRWQENVEAAWDAVAETDLALAGKRLHEAAGEALLFHEGDARLARTIEVVTELEEEAREGGDPDAVPRLLERISDLPRGRPAAPLRLWALHRLAALGGEAGDVERARSALARAFELARADLGDDHPVTLDAELRLAQGEIGMDQSAEALARAMRVAGRAESIFGPASILGFRALSVVGVAELEQGEPEAALETLERADAVWAQVGAPNASLRGERLQVTMPMVRAAFALGRLDVAERAIGEARAIAAVVPDAHRERVQALLWSARRHLLLANLREAEAEAELAAELADSDQVERRMRTYAVGLLAQVHAILGRESEVAIAVDRVRELFREADQSVPGELLGAGFAASVELEHADLAVGARPLVDELDREGRALLGVPSMLAVYMNDLAYALANAGRPSEAEPLALRVMEQRLARSPEYLAPIQDTLGLIRSQQGRHDDAVDLLATSLAGLEAREPDESPGLLVVLEHYEAALRGASDVERADEVALRIRRILERARSRYRKPTPRFQSAELGYSLDVPARWVDLGEEIAGERELALVRTSSHAVYGSLAVGDAGDRSVDGFMDYFAGALSSGPGEWQLGDRSVYQVRSLEGRRQTFRNEKSRGVIFMATAGGRVYELRVWSPSGSATYDEAVARAADELIDAFRVDPTTAAPATGPLHLASDRFGYAVELPGAGWQPWPGVRDTLDGAELGARHAEGAFAVIALSLLGTAPDRQAVVEVLAPVVDQAGVEAIRLEAAGLDGVELRSRGSGEARRLQRRSRILWDRGAVYLVHASGTDTEAGGRVLDAVDRFVLPDGSRSLPTTDDLSGPERRSHAAFFLGLGAHYAGLTHTSRALDFVRVASQLAPDDEPTFTSLATLLTRAGRFAEAREQLVAGGTRFPRAAALHALLGLVEGRLGKPEAAVEAYTTAFDLGFEDEDYFEDFVGQLWSAGRTDEARRRTEEKVRVSRSIRMRLVEAGLSHRAGELDVALEKLEAIEREAPSNTELLTSLAFVYLEAGRPRAALDAVDRYLALAPGHASIYLVQARAQADLGDFAAAKRTLERAREAGTGSEGLSQLEDAVSALLGQGDVSLVRKRIEPIPVDPSLVATRAAEEPAAAESYGAYADFDVRVVRFERGSPLRETHRRKLRVLDKRGLELASKISLPFNPLHDRLYVNELLVRDAAGATVWEFSLDGAYVLDRPEGDVTTDGKILHIPVGGLKPGVSVEFTVTREEIHPADELPFVEHALARSFPVAQATLVVEGDLERVSYRTTGALERSDQPGRLQWSTGWPEPLRVEPLFEVAEAEAPSVRLSGGDGSWEELAGEYLTQIEDKLAPSPRLTAFRESAGPWPRERGAKARALAKLVQGALTYRAVLFGRRAWIPNHPTEILERRFGDCKDHAVLLHRLLGDAGIPSRLALVRLRGRVDPELPALEQFDHMLVYCESCGGSPFLDPTDKYAEVGETSPPGLGGKVALVLDSEAPGLVTIPEDEGVHHGVRSRRRLELRLDGALTVTETASFSGGPEAWLRGWLLSLDAEQQRDAVQQLLMGGLAGATLTSFEVRGLDDVADDLLVTLQYELLGRFTKVGDLLSGRIPALWERRLLSVPRVERRRMPFTLRVPIEFESEVELEAPSGFLPVASEDVQATQQGTFSSWTLSRRGGPGQPLGFHSRLVRGAGGFPAGQYADLYAEMEAALATLETRLELVRAE